MRVAEYGKCEQSCAGFGAAHREQDFRLWSFFPNHCPSPGSSRSGLGSFYWVVHRISPQVRDWSGFTPLGVLECWVVDLPIGVLILVIGLLVKKGSPRLRKICIGTSCVVLALPVIASILLQSWHCP